MKILFVTPQLPYPPDKGATIRSLAMLKGLAQRGHQIHLLSFINAEEDLIWLPQIRPYVTAISTVLIPQRSMMTRLSRFVFSALPDMAWRLPSAEFADTLGNMLRQDNYDIVQFESIEVAQYALQAIEQRAPGAKKPVVVFDDLNAEFLLQKRAFDIDRKSPSKWAKAFYSWVQWRRLRSYESRVCTTVDRVLAVSETDATRATRSAQRHQRHRRAQWRRLRLLLTERPSGRLC